MQFTNLLSMNKKWTMNFILNVDQFTEFPEIHGVKLQDMYSR